MDPLLIAEGQLRLKVGNITNVSRILSIDAVERCRWVIATSLDPLLIAEDQLWVKVGNIKNASRIVSIDAVKPCRWISSLF